MSSPSLHLTFFDGKFLNPGKNAGSGTGVLFAYIDPFLCIRMPPKKIPTSLGAFDKEDTCAVDQSFSGEQNIQSG